MIQSRLEISIISEIQLPSRTKIRRGLKRTESAGGGELCQFPQLLEPGFAQLVGALSTVIDVPQFKSRSGTCDPHLRHNCLVVDLGGKGGKRWSRRNWHVAANLLSGFRILFHIDGLRRERHLDALAVKALFELKV